MGFQLKTAALLMAAASVSFASVHQARAAVPEFKAVAATSDDSLGSPANHATPAQVADDYKAFTEVYRDYAGLFSANDFRVPAAKKLTDKVNFDLPATQIKLAAFKKKIDDLQKQVRSYLLLTGVRVSEKQLPGIYKLAKQAAAALELRGNFNIFVINAPTFNAFTYSYNQNDFDVVLHSAAVEKLDAPAMLALLGHEMGHVKDQAILYKLVLASNFENENKSKPAALTTGFYDRLFDELPASIQGFDVRKALMDAAGDMAATSGTMGAIFSSAAEAEEFGRNCEVTADRAAVIAAGEAASLKLLAALAHGSNVLSADFNVDELVTQIAEVLATNDTPGEIEALANEQETHPFSVIRLVHAKTYAASKSYKTLAATLAQEPFAKEIDVVARNARAASDTAEKFKKYEAEKAENDDMLIRLKTEKQFMDSLEKLGGAVNTLGQLVLVQLQGSDLAKKDNAQFNTFVAKAKADATIRKVLLPAVLEILNATAKGATGDAAAEIAAKIKILETVKDLG